MKYYTPTINEFYSGFEYECLIKGEWKKISDFSNEYDYEDNPHYALSVDINNNKIRVKYLDKDDIESLGGIVLEGMNPFLLSSNGEKKEGLQYKINKVRLAHYPDNSIHIFELNSDLKVFTLFSGTIKNKSELTTLLKQLGI